MKEIFLISGESGSGKSTIVNSLSWNIIKSYTTRLQRDKYDNDHTFISRKDIGNYKDLVAITYIDNEFYFATEDQFIDGINLYIVDDKGIMDVQEYFKSDPDTILWTIKIVRDDIKIASDRRKRKINRYYNDYDYVLINNGSIKKGVEKLHKWVLNKSLTIEE